jgi:hypothetical protein
VNGINEVLSELKLPQLKLTEPSMKPFLKYFKYETETSSCKNIAFVSDSIYANLIRGSAVNTPWNVIWVPMEESFNNAFDTDKFNEIMWGVLETVFVNHCYNIDDSEDVVDSLMDDCEGSAAKTQRINLTRARTVKDIKSVRLAAEKVKSIKRVVRDIW